MNEREPNEPENIKKTNEERMNERSKKNQIKISDCQFLLVQSGAGGHTSGDQQMQQQLHYSKRQYYRY